MYLFENLHLASRRWAFLPRACISERLILMRLTSRRVLTCSIALESSAAQSSSAHLPARQCRYAADDANARTTAFRDTLCKAPAHRGFRTETKGHRGQVSTGRCRAPRTPHRRESAGRRLRSRRDRPRPQQKSYCTWPEAIASMTWCCRVRTDHPPCGPCCTGNVETPSFQPCMPLAVKASGSDFHRSQDSTRAASAASMTPPVAPAITAAPVPRPSGESKLLSSSIEGQSSSSGACEPAQRVSLMTTSHPDRRGHHASSGALYLPLDVHGITEMARIFSGRRRSLFLRSSSATAPNICCGDFAVDRFNRELRELPFDKPHPSRGEQGVNIGHVCASRCVKRSINSLPSSMMVRSALEGGIKYIMEAKLTKRGGKDTGRCLIGRGPNTPPCRADGRRDLHNGRQLRVGKHPVNMVRVIALFQRADQAYVTLSAIGAKGGQPVGACRADGGSSRFDQVPDMDALHILSHTCTQRMRRRSGFQSAKWARNDRPAPDAVFSDRARQAGYESLDSF